MILLTNVGEREDFEDIRRLIEPLAEGLGDVELEAKLFVNRPQWFVRWGDGPQPDWKAIHEQLQQHRHLTLQLVWQ